MLLRRAVPAAILLIAASPALAHHVMEGMMPVTLVQGLASGLGHPVIGTDHLAAILAAGAMASLTGMGVWLAVGFVVASVVGVGVHLLLIDIPWAEVLVAASVIGFGTALLIRARPTAAIVAGFIATGIVHGYAYGESIVGAEPAPLGGYLIGLLIVQAVLALAAWLVSRRLPGLLRPAGIAVTAVGAVALITALSA